MNYIFMVAYFLFLLLCELELYKSDLLLRLYYHNLTLLLELLAGLLDYDTLLLLLSWDWLLIDLSSLLLGLIWSLLLGLVWWLLLGLVWLVLLLDLLLGLWSLFLRLLNLLLWLLDLLRKLRIPIGTLVRISIHI